MAKFERLYAPSESETDVWEPVTNWRPHHFEKDEIKAALTGRTYIREQTPVEALSSVFSTLVSQSSGYHQDAFGQSYDRHWESVRVMSAQFHQMNDDEVIQMSPDPDEICNGCPIGRHCTATNLPTTGNGVDSAFAEARFVKRIHKDLLEKGCKEGRDFIFRPTEHTLYDYAGRTLLEEDNPSPVHVVFNSILVRKSAIRAIL